MQWVNVAKPRMMKQQVSLCVKSQTKKEVRWRQPDQAWNAPMAESPIA
jgi:hypothetical protein